MYPKLSRAASRGRRVVWLHAVSVGEVLAATRFVAELEIALSEGWTVVVSTTTRTGQELAKQRFGAERVFYMPLDFAFAVRAYLRVLQPAALLLMESELWPRLLRECRQFGTPVAVVNARVSDRSFTRAMKVRAVWCRVLRIPALWLAQSEEDARRLVAMGAREEAVRVGGNLKYDVRAPQQSRVAKLIKEVAAGRPIVVAGSTVASPGRAAETEEAHVVKAWRKRALSLGALLVLAPRHPERFEQAWRIVCDFASLKATDLLAGRRPSVVAMNGNNEEMPAMTEVVLLDTIGDLAAVYGIADVAFVGGSMVTAGGHNPLEPAQFSVPVIMGESFENFRDVVGKMKQADAIRVVRNGEELEQSIVELLTNRPGARAMGERGRQVFEAQQGATARAVQAVLTMMQRGKA